MPDEMLRSSKVKPGQRVTLEIKSDMTFDGEIEERFRGLVAADGSPLTLLKKGKYVVLPLESKSSDIH